MNVLSTFFVLDPEVEFDMISLEVKHHEVIEAMKLSSDCSSWVTQMNQQLYNFHHSRICHFALICIVGKYG